MEARPEQRHRHDHVHGDDKERAEDAMENSDLSLHHGASSFVRRRGEVGGRRGEIREVDFFSRDSGARRQDGRGHGLPGSGGRDHVNIGLDLLTTATATTTSAGDDEEGGTPKNQKREATVVEAELRRVVEENRRLRGMLEELTQSYGALYQQLLQVTQHHPGDLMNNRSSLTHGIEISLKYQLDRSF